MALSNCKYNMEQERISETGFVMSQAGQTEHMSVHSAVCHGPPDLCYLPESLDNTSLISQQQGDTPLLAVEMPQHLLHSVPKSGYEAKPLAAHGLEQVGHRELLHYQSPAQRDYCPPPTSRQQYVGCTGRITSSVPYPYQRIAPHINQDPHHLLYPKPIYSYSILIFMALKNSKTGSLPVSEIYNFMTEHFPYFKTAPDGWKNSVRHNLSLNKCFEKVENKFGGNSRKGCLWALNPSKMHKMQEELQKWRRKDPAAVRKSMAKPDQLDKLIGEKSDKTRPSVSVPDCAHLETVLPGRDTSHSSLGHVEPQFLLAPARLPPHSADRTHMNTSADPSESHSLPQVQQPKRSRAHADCVLEPSPSVHCPLLHNVSDVTSLLHVEQPKDKSAEHIPPESDPSTDIDGLNPSLVDFELQGNLWEVLRDENLTLDPLFSVVPFWTDVAGVTRDWGIISGPAEPQPPDCPGSGTKPCSHPDSSPVTLV
ncbi:forkhead box protein N1-like [Hypanus sabinus]|uniref:forkhead box protein N1-like n=1 Tax=Hypanus sabinus TaxID=79690 RepID=UPI0028C4D3E6|nr:forkhead box protein N1-like [Hypanus sabinus]